MRLRTAYQSCLALLGCLAASASVNTLRAQTVRGVVVDQTGRPVAGVVLFLVDTATNVSARALSGQSGEFRLGAARAGTYRVKTMRIGFKPSTSDAVALLTGGEATQRIVLAGAQISLDTVRVVDRNTCRMASDSLTAATFTVWDQARTALHAAQLTAAAHVVNATTVAYERTLDPNSNRVRDQRSTIQTGYVTQPWRTVAPDSLRRAGYVVSGNDWTTYYAPGLDALASDAFIEDHCFHLTTSRDASRIGIAFEPTPQRKRVAELQGTLWLDRKTSELRALEYHYVNVSYDQAGRAGGNLEFARLTNGGWAISRWDIRMPELVQVVRAPSQGGNRLEVSAMKVAGGELALAIVGRDTVWSRPPLVLSGVVTDSVTGATVRDAQLTLAGTSLAGLSDDRGRFNIPNVLPGNYTLVVRTPSLDSVSAMHTVAVSFTDSAASLRVRVPGAQSITASVCPRGAPNGFPGILLGSVAMRGDSTPPTGATVIADWFDIALRNEGGNVVTERRPRGVETKTDAAGAFRLCGVPVNTQLAVHAQTANALSENVDVRVAENGRFARAELMMDRVREQYATLTGAVVLDAGRKPIALAEVSMPDLPRTTLSDEKGMFRLDGIPGGEHRLVVRKIGYGVLDTTLRFGPGEMLNREVVLGRVQALDSVVINAPGNDRAMRDFEENRAFGLGHFLARAELAKIGTAHVGNAVRQLPGAGLVDGRGFQGWVLGTRKEPPGCFPGPGFYVCLHEHGYYVPGSNEKMQGIITACYAQVYLDGHLMNSGWPAEPFDVNMIAIDQLEGVEWYASAAETPMRYTSSRSVCGVLVLHTRRPDSIP
jgi:hypothetical protein